jgi:formate dehydrogenase maturation protein FdhE
MKEVYMKGNELELNNLYTVVKEYLTSHHLNLEKDLLKEDGFLIESTSPEHIKNIPSAIIKVIVEAKMQKKEFVISLKTEATNRDPKTKLQLKEEEFKKNMSIAQKLLYWNFEVSFWSTIKQAVKKANGITSNLYGNDERIRYCPICGAAMPEGVSTCPHCGALKVDSIDALHLGEQ